MHGPVIFLYSVNLLKRDFLVKVGPSVGSQICRQTFAGFSSPPVQLCLHLRKERLPPITYEASFISVGDILFFQRNEAFCVSCVWTVRNSVLTVFIGYKFIVVWATNL
jgi:hypothetical protein